MIERERTRRIEQEVETGHGCRLSAVTKRFGQETSQSVNKQVGNSPVRLLISQSVKQKIDGAVSQLLTGY